jgi:hypothetical protein
MEVESLSGAQQPVAVHDHLPRKRSIAVVSIAMLPVPEQLGHCSFESHSHSRHLEGFDTSAGRDSD